MSKNNIEYIKGWFKQIANGRCKGIPMISPSSLDSTIQCNLQGITIEDMYKLNKQSPIFVQNWTNGKPAIALFQKETPSADDEVWVCYFPTSAYDEEGHYTGEGMTSQQKQGILSDFKPELNTKDLCQLLDTNRYSIGFGISTGIQKWELPEPPANWDEQPENLKKGYEKEEKDVKEQKNYDAGYDIGNNSVNSSDVEIKEVQTESLDNKKNKNRLSLSEALKKLKEDDGFDLLAELEEINELFKNYNSKL